MKIPNDVLLIMNTLSEAGYEAYAVGGCVRDSLLGREPKDWDITTDALPEAVKALFRRTIDTGIEHGTVTVMRGKTGYEVTTYRLDGAYSDGRHPDSVTFTPELREDLRRRDFTINAMACAADGTIVDLFGGQEDLEKQVVRCVGDPDERFKEDALRILRAVRFSAQLDFAIEPETWEALRRHAPNLVHVSRERILAELTKTLLSEHPERLSELGPAGILEWLPEQFAECHADRRAAALPEERSVRWAGVFAESAPETVRDLLKELKSDRDTMDRAALLVREVKKALPETAAETRILLSEIGPERFADLILLKTGEGLDRRSLRCYEILQSAKHEGAYHLGYVSSCFPFSLKYISVGQFRRAVENGRRKKESNAPGKDHGCSPGGERDKPDGRVCDKHGDDELCGECPACGRRLGGHGVPAG